MKLMNKILEVAKADKKRIVLPEGNEERTIVATEEIYKQGYAHPILVGNKEEILNKATALNADLTGVEIIDPETSENLSKYIEAFYELRKNKGMTMSKAEKIVRDPLYFGTMMVKLGDADGMVSGSFFIMMVPDSVYGEEGMLLFSDCAVNPNPNEDQLAAIAIATAETAKNLCKVEPRVAMLSFSTMGSADHELVSKVRTATASQKAPNSKVAGKANVLVFPDLQAGNIGYKLVQRFAKAEAIGPICQGFAKPINDLSRGCSSEDIVKVVAITAVQAQSSK